jgi:hypothetical protein
MIFSAHQPQYLPWLGYFDKIAKSDCFVFLDRVQYKHREYQNRNRIYAFGKSLWLTVPVISKGLREQLVCDVKIDNSLNWQSRHWKSLQSYYAKAKFFKDYVSFFEEVYAGKKWERLIDLNIFIIRHLLKQFQINTPLYFESEIGTAKLSTERIIEIAKKLNAKAYLSGAGGKDYLDEQRFIQEGIELKYQDFRHPQYRQQSSGGGKAFIPNLSAIDLLFNAGEMSKKILSGEG